jgi:hypothetical protein
MAWTTPRTWNPGETVTASLMNTHVRDQLNVLKTSINNDGTIATSAFLAQLGLGKLIFARSTSDFTKNNSTTLGDVTGLVFAIGASETWAFEFVLAGISPTAADWKFAVTFPSSPTAVRYGVDGSNPAFGADGATGTAGGVIQRESIGFEEGLCVRGLVRNGANAGNVQLQMAQWAAVVGDTIIRADSFVIGRRVA